MVYLQSCAHYFHELGRASYGCSYSRSQIFSACGCFAQPPFSFPVQEILGQCNTNLACEFDQTIIFRPTTPPIKRKKKNKVWLARLITNTTLKFMTLTILCPIKVSLGVARFFVVVEFQMAQPSPRYRHFSAAIVDKLYVWGGLGAESTSSTSIVHHYDPDSETWNTNITCEGPHPPGISCGACASAGHHLYTYGGYDERGIMQGTLHLLDTKSRRWKLISSQGGPMKKRGSRMIVYDSKIVLFGGHGNSGRTNELHTFNLKEGERLHIAMYPLIQFSCVAGVVVSNSDLDIERGIVCYTLALLIFGSNVSHSQVPIQTLFDTAVDIWACSLIFMCFLPSPSQVHGPPRL